MSKAPEKPVAASDAPAKKKKPLVLIITALAIVLGGGGAGAAWFMKKKHADEETVDAADEGKAAGAHGKSAKKKKHGDGKLVPPMFIPLDSFTVNLQPEDDEHFLQVIVSLQVADQPAADAIKAYMPNIRNRILLLLSSKKASELISVAGKQKLAEEIVQETLAPISQTLGDEAVTNAFFTSFVIQ